MTQAVTEAITNVMTNIKNNKILLYSTIVYVVILFILLLILYVIFSRQKTIMGLERVSPPMGKLGVDKPQDR